MAMSSKCPKCGNSTFEFARETPKESAFYYMFIRCDACGAVVGVTDGYNLGEMLRQQREAIRKIALHAGIPVTLDND